MKRSALLSALLISSSILGFADSIPEPKPITKVTEISSSNYSLEWIGLLGHTYFVQSSSNLRSWKYMPAILSGTGGPQTYEFNSTDRKTFLRLHFTSIPTDDPLAADFDGDGISNWDEVRIGGSVTDPFLWDSDGDGKSDYYADKNNNGLADGWEATYGNLGDLDPNADDDEDGLTNAQEASLGTNPNAKSTDGDALWDGEDADPLDKAVAWKKTPESQYVVLKIGSPANVTSDNTWGYSLGENGHVLMSRDQSDQWPGGDGVPGTEYFKTYVWDVFSGVWSSLLGLPVNLRGIGSRIDKDGNVYGDGFGALGTGESGPGVQKTSIRWEKATIGWNDAEAHGAPWLGAGFSSKNDTSTSVPLGLDVPVNIFGNTGWFAAESVSPAASLEIITSVIRHGTNTSSAFVTVTGQTQIENYKQAGEPRGWHCATWTKTEHPTTGNTRVSQEYIFARLLPDKSLQEKAPPEGEDRWKLFALASIGDDYRPDGDDEIVIWSMTDASFQSGTIREGVMTWQPSTKVDITKRLGGKVNMRGEGLKGDKLWRNGKWYKLSEFVDATKWTDLQGIDINSEGLILASASEVGGGYTTILLLPVEIVEVHFGISDEVPTLKNDANDKLYLSPQWLDKNGDGDPLDVADGKQNYPVAYASKTKPEIKAVFKIKSLPQGLNIKIRATGSDGIQIPATSAIIKGEKVTLPITESTNPLILEIRKNDGTVVSEIEFPVNISGVESMFRSKFLNENLSGGTQGGVPTSPSNWPDLDRNGKHFIFVHGYNVSGEQSRGWHSEAFKRMFWSGSNAMFTGVSWHGNHSQIIGVKVSPDYWRNVHNAFQTSKSVADFVNALPGEGKCIAAHSLGNVVVSSAIKDHGLNVTNYYMVDAAAPIEAYDKSSTFGVDKMSHPQWRSYARHLWASDWHKLFQATPSDKRNGLTWIDRFGTFPQAYNFHSTGEEVLKNGTGIVPDIGAVRSWVNSEMLKAKLPASLLSSDSGGWEFSNFHDVFKVFQYDPVYIASYVRMDPVAAAAIPKADLAEKPFFVSFDNGNLHNANPLMASAEADKYDVRAETLAESIPALTFAAGANPIDTFNPQNPDDEEKNFDMNGPDFKINGWPIARTANPDPALREWRHSDIREMAYLYTYKVYEKWIELGELKK